MRGAQRLKTHCKSDFDPLSLSNNLDEDEAITKAKREVTG